MTAWQERIKLKQSEIERLKKQIDYLAEQYDQQKQLLQDEKTSLVVTEKQVKESKEELEKVFPSILLFSFLLFIGFSWIC